MFRGGCGFRKIFGFFHSRLATEASAATDERARPDPGAVPIRHGRTKNQSHWGAICFHQRDFLSLKPKLISIHESTSLSKTPLRKLPNCEAEERRACHLQERAAQAAAGLRRTAEA